MVEKTKVYSLEEALNLLEKTHQVKFDETVDINIKLGIDLKKTDQLVRGSSKLPHGTGKTTRVLVFCESEKEEQARKAGADFVGGKDLIEKISGGWLEFDYCIATPGIMKDVSKLGKVLGPRGLMPSPKVGTVTENLAVAVTEAKQGKIDFKMDKLGCVNVGIGKISFGKKKIAENADVFINSLLAAKPAGTKGKFVKSATISTTMGPGLKIALVEDVEK